MLLFDKTYSKVMENTSLVRIKNSKQQIINDCSLNPNSAYYTYSLSK